MEKARTLAVAEGNVIKKAEIDEWFKTYGAIIRPLRDKIEADDWETGGGQAEPVTRPKAE